MPLTEWEKKMKELHIQEMKHLGEALSAVRATLDSLDAIQKDLSAAREAIFGNK